MSSSFHFRLFAKKGTAGGATDTFPKPVAVRFSRFLACPVITAPAISSSFGSICIGITIERGSGIRADPGRTRSRRIGGTHCPSVALSCSYGCTFSPPRRSAACRSFGRILPPGCSGGRRTDIAPVPSKTYHTSGRIWRQGRFPLRRSM